MRPTFGKKKKTWYTAKREAGRVRETLVPGGPGRRLEVTQSGGRQWQDVGVGAGWCDAGAKTSS